jgi:protein involved in polysaccharide export with SLBB domain
MTLTDWRSNIDLAMDLKKILDNPVMQHALSVLDGMTMAKTLALSGGIVQLADKSHVLFGYDAGRASIISDLQQLAIVPEDKPVIEPTYQGEF